MEGEGESRMTSISDTFSMSFILFAPTAADGYMIFKSKAVPGES